MGKASRWFRGLLGLKKSEHNTSDHHKPPKEKRRWSFVKSYREDQPHNTAVETEHVQNNNNNNNNNNKQAIAVAAATAAAAEAAVAAAAVVRFNYSSNGIVRIREQWAAVKIQSAFRGSLARKALRALKGLVKLQALVRGHIERKRTAEWLKKMQSLLRAQARYNAARTMQISHSHVKSSTFHHLHGPPTPEKSEESPVRSRSVKSEHSPTLKRNSSKSCLPISGNLSENQLDEQSWNRVRSLIRNYSRSDEKHDRIVEIDSGKQHMTTKRRNLFHSISDTDHYYYSQNLTPTKESKSYQSTQSQSCEVQSYYNLLKLNEGEESSFCTANNSPQLLSATSKDDGYKRSPFTPTRSDGSRNYLKGYSDYPSYMAYTESSKAKVRSLSAPKQRPQFEKSGSSNRYSLNGHDMARLATMRTSALQTSFTSKGYPGSGRLDKLGMPVGYR